MFLKLFESCYEEVRIAEDMERKYELEWGSGVKVWSHSHWRFQNRNLQMAVQRLIFGGQIGFEFVPGRAVVTGVLFGVSMTASMSLKKK